MITQILLFLIHVCCFVAVYAENVAAVVDVGCAAVITQILLLMILFWCFVAV